MPIFENRGICPICEKEAVFTAENEWFRDHYVCSGCQSIPRERALMLAIQTFYPDWKKLAIHESSPGNRGVSTRLQCECKNYVPSQFFPDRPLGKVHQGVQCQNLEALTFPDESFDLHITQDVMEHVFNPAKAFAEIARTLKPGGAHIASVPLVNKAKP
jgi:SAM-dependent methyltransferase